MTMGKFDMDYARYNNKVRLEVCKWASVFRDRILKAIYFARKSDEIDFKIFSKFLAKRSKELFEKNGIEVGQLKNIGGGICFVHPFNITINSRAQIGNDFTIFKGATIGSIRSGAKKGSPIIGDRVTLCSNAFVCGKIKIGNDVLIAANAFVNFDVPSNSIVIGNPGQIYQKNNPSADYLTIK